MRYMWLKPYINVAHYIISSLGIFAIAIICIGISPVLSVVVVFAGIGLLVFNFFLNDMYNEYYIMVAGSRMQTNYSVYKYIVNHPREFTKLLKEDNLANDFTVEGRVIYIELAK